MTDVIPYNYIRDYSGDAYGPDSPRKIFEAHKQLLAERIEELEPIIREALDHYIDWLNSFADENNEDRYTIDDFFRFEGHNPDGYLFGLHYETHTRVDVRSDLTRYIQFSAGTGDDGGPATLYILIDENYDEPLLRLVIQEFDTNYSIVYLKETT